MLKLHKTLTAALTAMCFAASPALAGGEGWTHDYEAAKTQAADEGKDMLMDFTGSDWCGWCIRLVNEVFSQDDFKAYAEKNLVLVEIDFPRDKSKLTEATIAQNDKLKDQFGVRGFPTIYLTDSKGRPYAQTGYRQGGPGAYIEHLEELKKARVERDKHFDAAEKAEGVEKAKHLDAGLKVLNGELVLAHYGEVIDQIKALDADNKAGLGKYYEDLQAAADYREQIGQIVRGARNDPEGSLKKLDELLANDNVLPEIQQQALVMKSQIKLSLQNDKPAAKALLEQAIAADPDSEIADNLREALERVFGEPEPEEAPAEAEAEAAE